MKLEDIKDPRQRAMYAAAAGVPTPGVLSPKSPVGKLPPHPGVIQAVKESGVLNKTETRFYEILKQRHPAPAVIRIMPWRFQLGFKCSYLCDFAVVDPPHRITMYEVKGPWIEEDAIVKFKTASRMFPEFRFILAQFKNGEWTETEYR